VCTQPMVWIPAAMPGSFTFLTAESAATERRPGRACGMAEISPPWHVRGQKRQYNCPSVEAVGETGLEA
jgi:hypothetical protein